MALTADVHKVRYGGPGNAHQPFNFPMRASPVVAYRGSIALTDSGGFIKNSASPLTTDTCWGLIDQIGPGGVDTAPGITGGTADGAVTVDVESGTFFLASGTGADQLSAATVGQKVYVINETTVGLVSTSRPLAGVHIAVDTTRTDAPGPYAIALGPLLGGGP